MLAPASESDSNTYLLLDEIHLVKREQEQIMKNSRKNSVLMAKSGLAVVIAVGLSNVAAAHDSPFVLDSMDSGYKVLAEGACGGKDKHKETKEGKFGEGKCGTKSQGNKAKEGRCGSKTKTEGKCGEGKCGADH